VTAETTATAPDGGGTEAPTQRTSPAGGTTTHEIVEGVTVEAPSAWFPVEYRGVLPPVYFPLWFFSTSEYTGACSSGGPSQACNAGGGYFPPDWVTPDDGVIVLWSESQFPGNIRPALAHLPGDITTINGHRARVWTGTATRACSRVASTEMDAFVVRDEHDNPGVRIDMKACFGEHAPDGVRAAVRTMLDSLTIKS
jgi:hypothetical protein